MKTLIVKLAVVSMLCLGMTQGTARAQKLELAIRTSHSDRVESVAVSPDGKLIASSGGNLILWDAGDGTFIKQLGGQEHQDFIVFSPNGKILASCNSEQLILWDTATGEQLKKWKGSFYGVNEIAFSPGGETLATTDINGSITIWDAASGTEIKRFAAHETSLSVAFSPDGKVLASSGQDKEAPIKIWEVGTWNLINSLKGHQTTQGILRVWSVEFSPDGKTVATSSFDNTVRLWDWKSGENLQTFTGHSDLDRSIAFSPDGKILATSGEGQIKLWSTSTGESVLILGEKQTKEHSDAVLSMRFSGDGQTLVSSSTDSYTALDVGTIFWNIATGKPTQTLISKRIFTVAPSNDGKTLAVNFGADIKLVNLANIQSFKTLKGHSQAIAEVSFSPDGKVLASGSKDTTIKLWDTLSGKELKTLRGHDEEVRAVTFSPDGKVLASGSEDGAVRLWDVNTRLRIKTLQQDGRGNTLGNQVMSLAYSPDGKFLAGGSFNKVLVWDAMSGRNLKTLPVEDGWVWGLMFSPDGKTLVTTSRDKISLHDLSTSQEINAGQDKLPDWLLSSSFMRVIQVGGRMIRIVPEGSVMNLAGYADNKVFARVVLLDENDWAVITPDGRFDASEGGQNLMHYTYGLEIINLEQLKEGYYEPGLLQKLLGFSKEPLRPIVPLKDVRLYPEIVAQSIEPQTGRLTIKLKNRGGGIGKTEVFINDRIAVPDARDEALRQNPNVPAGEIVTLTVALPVSSFIKGKENQIKVVTSNYLREIGKGNIQSRGLSISYLAAGREDYSLPTLYAIVGGVSDYAGEQLHLRFAAKDAEDFSDALALGARRLFCAKDSPGCVDKVQITTLSTSGKEGVLVPTKENFKRAFEDIAAKASPEDILVVYLAGHGVSFGAGTDTYFYLTQEARALSHDSLSKVLSTSTISSEELTEWLTQTEWTKGQKGIRALKQVLILDTCASGVAAERIALLAKRDLSGDQIRAIEFLQNKTGTFVLMGSTADAPSYEASQYGQGLLTYSLLQAMKGAALAKGEYVDVQTLFNYAQAQVPRMAMNIGGVQEPVVSAPLGKTFLIGQMTDADKNRLQLPAPKPLFLRPLLTNPETGDDDLRLIPALRRRLDAESSYEVMRRSGRGAPVLIYIDDDSFPGAARITGTYTIEGDKVRVKPFFRRDGQTVATLPEIFTAKENVLDELLSAIRVALAKIR